MSLAIPDSRRLADAEQPEAATAVLLEHLESS